MIVELPNSDFYKCSSLLYEQGQLEAKAVIEGINPGRIFVDDLITPISGLIWLGNNDGFIFFGDEDNENFNNAINHYIDNLISPEAKRIGLNWFEGVGNHPKWDKTIEEIFQERQLGKWNQKVYTLQKGNYQYSSEPAIEPEYHVLKITKALYENNDHSIKYIDFFRSKILEFWTSPECFFHKGIGYCIVFDHTIVSICLSGFVVDNTHCIDIETIAAHQGKKLAQKLAHSFVQDCLRNDWIPYWDCMEGNKPSIAVAESIGFTNVFDYVGYEFSFK